VSLVTDIVQLFGTSSVPVVVAGTVLGVFELGERFAKGTHPRPLSGPLGVYPRTRFPIIHFKL
jgi:hypothetical protein